MSKREVAEFWKKRDPKKVEEIVAYADMFCRHEFLFNTENDLEQMDEPIFYDKKIDWEYKPGDDIEYIFQFNRHRYFITLGQAYQLTGDEKYAECYVDMITDWIKENPLIEAKKNTNWRILEVGFRGEWNLVDWPENLRDGYDFTLSRPIVADGCHNVVNALYIGAMKTLTEIEDILKLPHTVTWENYLSAFYNVFYNQQTKLFVDSEGSTHSAVHSNVYPLYFGLVAKEQEENIVDFLEKKGLCCGVFLSYFFLKGIAKAGKYDVVYKLLVNETEHGWINMLREGATTCYEAWGREQKWNTSLCHPWASAPIPVMIEDIAGFTPYIDANGALDGAFHPHIPDEVESFCLELQYCGKNYSVKK